MTPIIVAVAVAVIIVVGVFLVLMTRSRRDDEGERFRRVADLTSRWSRQVQSAPTDTTPPYGPESRAGIETGDGPPQGSARRNPSTRADAENGPDGALPQPGQDERKITAT